MSTKREPQITVLRGECVDMMSKLEAESVDAIVTDPPYELGFMGKSWDSAGVSYDPNTWAQALRVLKPGGHLLAFGGSRTYHRIAVAIEDAGFEIRDSLMWIYGSGFPKSLDVSKTIDKRGGASISWFGPWLRKERKRRGISYKSLAAHFPSKNGKSTGCVGNWELGRGLPTAKQWNKLIEVLDLPFEALVEANREVVGVSVNGIAGGSGRHAGAENAYGFAEAYDITTPATEEAKRWEGWGTALKPSHEPIVLARKPLIGTVAENVLAHGTGALNIDTSRIEAHGESFDGLRGRNNGFVARRVGESEADYAERVDSHPSTQKAITKLKELGRWPANTLWDEEAAAQLDASTSAQPSRFFYVAKPSRSERNAGGAANIHPTVKPIALMRYLIKLVTPPGGTVLDPFLGSGSTACAAALEGFDCVGIEMNNDYADIAEARIKHWKNGGDE